MKHGYVCDTYVGRLCVEHLIKVSVRVIMTWSQQHWPAVDYWSRGNTLLSFRFPVTMVFFSIASWETFLRILLPQASAMHICWMFRLHGSARLVRLAEWLYCFTFDLCTRVGSNTPAAVRKTMLPSSSGVRHPMPCQIYKCSRLTFFSE